MAKINILNENTIDKIAAGEVVERPASVVKELVENAIDSKATSITIEIKDGGISLIRVTDNGTGIDKEQIPKAFLRHATSKITDVMDLFKISSLGFRGEALSSICAVSQLELLTKTKEDFAGSRYIINGGREEIFEDAGVPNGTTILVRNLFYNTPARKKFLKSSNTEAGYISSLIEKLILSHPDISFKYMVNGIDKIASPGNGDLKAAVYSVFGQMTTSLMTPVDFSNEIFDLKGFIGKPEIARSNRNYEFFFVNNRIVKSRILTNAIEDAYKNYLMLHKYPFVVLYFDIDPAKLDINVHPAKTEIKFLEESFLYEKLCEVIERTLSGRELIPDVSANNSVVDRTAENKAYVNRISPDVTSSDTAAKKAVNLPEPFETVRIAKAKITKEKESEEQSGSITKEKETEAQSGSIKPGRDSEHDIKEGISGEQISLFNDEFLSKEAAVHHRIIGQLFDTYWLVEYDNKLYIIDQHAAHEKVLYEKIKKRLSENEAVSQMISPPEIVSLSSSQEECLKTYSENLIDIGFEWEHFGGREYSVNAVPCDLFGFKSNDYFITILDDLSVGKKPSPEAVNDRIATMACKAAVKANMRLSEKEARSLIDQLMKLENPYNCPHGRPVIISYGKTEIEKLFKRIV